MNSDLSLTLTASLIFLVLSSKVACNFFCKVAKLSDDMSAVARTVVFGLLLMGAMRIM